MQPTRKPWKLKPKLIEINNTFNWGGFGSMKSGSCDDLLFLPLQIFANR